jgi:hypothetical protein
MSNQEVIATYNTVEAYGVYKHEVFQEEVSWETWAEHIDSSLEVNIVCETSVGTLVIQRTCLGSKVAELSELSQQLRIKQEAEINQIYANYKKENTFKALVKTLAASLVLTPFVLATGIWAITTIDTINKNGIDDYQTVEDIQKVSDR